MRFSPQGRHLEANVVDVNIDAPSCDANGTYRKGWVSDNIDRLILSVGHPLLSRAFAALRVQRALNFSKWHGRQLFSFVFSSTY